VSLGCLLARRVVRQIGQYLVPALFGEHVTGVGADACGVVGVEVEDAYGAVSGVRCLSAVRALGERANAELKIKN
jgi:hypothetical protein